MTEPVFDHRVAAKGLTTVAILKANYDAGMDYIGMFMPFITDAIVSLDTDEFDLPRVRNRVVDRHGLSIPLDTLQILLKRCARDGLIRREGGRYFRAPSIAAGTLAKERRVAEREVRAVANALMGFASQVGGSLGSIDDAMAWIFAFLSEHQVQLLLEDDPEQLELKTGFLNLRQTRIVARFVQDVLANHPQLARYLDRVVEGYVLQNALLLRDISSVRGKFHHLEVYLDSGFVFALLGFAGEARRLANAELIDLVRAVNGIPRMFDRTVLEMKRILDVYERHLATPEGRESLWTTDLTRHYLRRHATPSDVRQDIALLDEHIREGGITVVSPPKRVPEFTLDESDLAQRLTRPGQKSDEPRIVHDVECIAGVLSIRRGRFAHSIDETNAIFVTSSGRVLRTVQEWYETQVEESYPPVIHQHTFSNHIWLKRPASGSRLKLHELVAMCAAALKPSRRTWERFLKHLRNLEASGDITSDEAVAIVVAGLTDVALAEVEEEDDPDATSLSEVVDRVKADYRSEADARVNASELLAREAMTSRSADRIHLESRIRTVARLVGSAVFWLLLISAGVGSVLLLPSVLESIWPPAKWLAWGAILLFTVIATAGLAVGLHLGHVRDRIERIVFDKLRAIFVRGVQQ